MRAYARKLRTRVRVKDGSGIGRKDQTSAEHVGELLVAMLDEPAADEFYESLPRAGLEGTRRQPHGGDRGPGDLPRQDRHDQRRLGAVGLLRRSPAATPIVFSILMNGIGSNYTTARNLQDRMVVAIAQYSG